jgi:hypothetical protein
VDEPLRKTSRLRWNWGQLATSNNFMHVPRIYLPRSKIRHVDLTEQFVHFIGGEAFEPKAGVEGEVEPPKIIKWCLFQPRTEHLLSIEHIRALFNAPVKVALCQSLFQMFSHQWIRDKRHLLRHSGDIRRWNGKIWFLRGR